MELDRATRIRFRKGGGEGAVEGGREGNRGRGHWGRGEDEDGGDGRSPRGKGGEEKPWVEEERGEGRPWGKGEDRGGGDEVGSWVTRARLEGRGPKQGEEQRAQRVQCAACLVHLHQRSEGQGRGPEQGEEQRAQHRLGPSKGWPSIHGCRCTRQAAHWII